MSHIADVNEAISHAEAIALMPGLPPLAGERLGCLLVVLDRVRAEWPEPQAAPGVTPLVEAIRAELGVPIIAAADKVRRLTEVKDAAVASAKHWQAEVERLRTALAGVAALPHFAHDPDDATPCMYFATIDEKDCDCHIADFNRAIDEAAAAMAA